MAQLAVKYKMLEICKYDSIMQGGKKRQNKYINKLKTKACSCSFMFFFAAKSEVNSIKNVFNSQVQACYIQKGETMILYIHSPANLIIN